MAWELAQVNIGRLRAPLDDPALADFVAALEPVNAAADAAPGFRWRLATEDGDATAIRAFEWDAADSAGVIVNMSTWDSLDSLAAFTFGELHRAVLRRRREWFERISEAYTALWWVPVGERPTTANAEARIRHLRLHGPTPTAFTLRASFPPPESTAGGATGAPDPGHDDWLCPA
ncbi:DUF3291 domain-containing protein [Cryptosporangium minutisporangium]|uniref:DUF3291 domain-containing protein n=1 Tax=Cryptosporangium minutisporangium TaxID=113569 RepID=A0ABP6TAL4_9ACTN